MHYDELDRRLGDNLHRLRLVRIATALKGHKVKNWQLIAELSKLPAGAEIAVTAYPEGTRNAVHVVHLEDGEIQIDGDGQYRDDLELACNKRA
jgi:hypothetical protein